jgi:hypothetical protein
MDLYIHSTIRLHGVVLKLVKHKDNFTLFTLLLIHLSCIGRRRAGADNIKIDLTEIGRDGMDWIDLAQDKAVQGSC